MFQRRKSLKSNKSITVSSISSVSVHERAVNLGANLIKALDTKVINQCSSNRNIRLESLLKETFIQEKLSQKERLTTLCKSCPFLTDEVIYLY